MAAESLWPDLAPRFGLGAEIGAFRVMGDDFGEISGKCWSSLFPPSVPGFGGSTLTLDWEDKLPAFADRHEGGSPSSVGAVESARPETFAEPAKAMEDIVAAPEMATGGNVEAEAGGAMRFSPARFSDRVPEAAASNAVGFDGGKKSLDPPSRFDLADRGIVDVSWRGWAEEIDTLTPVWPGRMDSPPSFPESADANVMPPDVAPRSADPVEHASEALPVDEPQPPSPGFVPLGSSRHDRQPTVPMQKPLSRADDLSVRPSEPGSGQHAGSAGPRPAAMRGAPSGRVKDSALALERISPPRAETPTATAPEPPTERATKRVEHRSASGNVEETSWRSADVAQRNASDNDEPGRAAFTGAVVGSGSQAIATSPLADLSASVSPEEDPWSAVPTPPLLAGEDRRTARAAASLVSAPSGQLSEAPWAGVNVAKNRQNPFDAPQRNASEDDRTTGDGPVFPLAAIDAPTRGAEIARTAKASPVGSRGEEEEFGVETPSLDADGGRGPSRASASRPIDHERETFGMQSADGLRENPTASINLTGGRQPPLESERRGADGPKGSRTGVIEIPGNTVSTGSTWGEVSKLADFPASVPPPVARSDRPPARGTASSTRERARQAAEVDLASELRGGPLASANLAKNAGRQIESARGNASQDEAITAAEASSSTREDRRPSIPAPPRFDPGERTSLGESSISPNVPAPTFPVAPRGRGQNHSPPLEPVSALILFEKMQDTIGHFVPASSNSLGRPASPADQSRARATERSELLSTVGFNSATAISANAAPKGAINRRLPDQIPSERLDSRGAAVPRRAGTPPLAARHAPRAEAEQFEPAWPHRSSAATVARDDVALTFVKARSAAATAPVSAADRPAIDASVSDRRAGTAAEAPAPRSAIGAVTPRLAAPMVSRPSPDGSPTVASALAAVAPKLSPPQSRSPRRGADEPAPPIRVTIGTIVVAAPPQPAAAPLRRSGPAISLREYLGRRRPL